MPIRHISINNDIDLYVQKLQLGRQSGCPMSPMYTLDLVRMCWTKETFCWFRGSVFCTHLVMHSINAISSVIPSLTCCIWSLGSHINMNLINLTYITRNTIRTSVHYRNERIHWKIIIILRAQEVSWPLNS